ncbi:hypothetical protein ACP70R_000395 [Stipagrostis hirtigluma subsp. patula]
MAGGRSHSATAYDLPLEREPDGGGDRRFCDLRATVPTVSWMELLAAAAAYIVELRGHEEQLAAEAMQAAAPKGACAVRARGESWRCGWSGGRPAALRLTTDVARHMDALRSLDMPVRHACVGRLLGGAAGRRLPPRRAAPRAAAGRRRERLAKLPWQRVS